MVHNCTQACRSARTAIGLLPATGVHDSYDKVEGNLGTGYNQVAKTLIESIRSNGVLAYDSAMIVEDIVNSVSLNMTNLRQRGDTYHVYGYGLHVRE